MKIVFSCYQYIKDNRSLFQKDKNYALGPQNIKKPIFY